MKLEELEPESQLEVRSKLDDEMDLLRTQALNAGSEARRYLFFVNTGGAIALVSFMGASPDVRGTLAAWLALGSFFAGIIAVGVLHALNWHVLIALLMGYVRDVRAVYVDQIDLNEFDQRRQKVMPRRWPGLLVSYVAALFFLLGSAIAIFGLMPPFGPKSGDQVVAPEDQSTQKKTPAASTGA